MGLLVSTGIIATTIMLSPLSVATAGVLIGVLGAWIAITIVPTDLNRQCKGFANQLAESRMIIDETPVVEVHGCVWDGRGPAACHLTVTHWLGLPPVICLWGQDDEQCARVVWVMTAPLTHDQLRRLQVRMRLVWPQTGVASNSV